MGCSYLQCIYIIHAHISQDGWTALHLAAQEGHWDVVELLLEAKAYPQPKIHEIFEVKLELTVKSPIANTITAFLI